MVSDAPDIASMVSECGEDELAPSESSPHSETIRAISDASETIRDGFCFYYILAFAENYRTMF